MAEGTDFVNRREAVFAKIGCFFEIIWYNEGRKVRSEDNGMNETVISYESLAEGKTVRAFIYKGDGEPRGIIQILHGMVEHIGRYRELAAYLTERGYIVCGNNHLGHGEGYDEKERGYFGEKNGWETLMQDAVTLSEYMLEEYPYLPIIYFGHSMGSFLARSIHLSGMFCPDGMILSGTGQLPSLLVFCGRLVGGVLSICHRTKCVESKLMNALTVGGYGKKFKDEGQNAWISSLPDEVAAYESDALCGYPAKLGLFTEMLKGISFVIDQRAVNASESIPILLVSGEDDPVGDMGKGVKKVFRAYAKAGFDDLSLLLYPSARHEFLHDTVKDTALCDIEAWLSEHTTL